MQKFRKGWPKIQIIIVIKSRTEMIITVIKCRTQIRPQARSSLWWRMSLVCLWLMGAIFPCYHHHHPVTVIIVIIVMPHHHYHCHYHHHHHHHRRRHQVLWNLNPWAETLQAVERDFLLENNETFAETVQFISGDHSATVEETFFDSKDESPKNVFLPPPPFPTSQISRLTNM